MQSIVNPEKIVIFEGHIQYRMNNFKNITVSFRLPPGAGYPIPDDRPIGYGSFLEGIA